MFEKKSDENNPGGINPFVTGLSIVNLFYSILMTLFGYTLYFLLVQQGVSLYWGALGTTLGQVVLLVILIPQGKAIDQGHSYSLMIAGSLIYSVSIGALYLSGYLFRSGLVLLIPVAVLIATASQNTFRSSMNSFIGKAVKHSLMGSNYARILTMEMVGGAVAMLIAFLFDESSSIKLAYLLFPILLAVVVILVFTLLFRDSRIQMTAEVSRSVRPTFLQGIRTLRSRKRFVVPIYLGKIFMAIGYYGFSYYFILTGIRIGIPAAIPVLLLALIFAASIPFGKLAESLLKKYSESGRIYVIFLSIIDIFSYLFLLLATVTRNVILYYISVAIMVPGPLPTAGALSYEVRMVGPENRGVYSSIQRMIVAFVIMGVSLPMVVIFYASITYLWIFIFATSVMGLVFGFLLPRDNIAVSGTTS